MDLVAKRGIATLYSGTVLVNGLVGHASTALRAYVEEMRIILTDKIGKFQPRYAGAKATIELLQQNCKALIPCFLVHVFRDIKKRPGEEGDADSSRETSSDGGSECGAERGTNHAQGAWSQRNNMRAMAQSFNQLSVDKGKISDPPGFLLFEYFDSAPPFSREPLADKASFFLFPRKFSCFSLNALLPS
ncbi:hypothetical protein RHMOL_Rhmol06G0214800 [Rhododendron molle]|uniref:Uncharacterized protein n=1 Tax=Rhododendron molle TaxID=49168 RepID=A0ACC0NFW4_RHOML|nr:hypothetical protein RHMOL_Rhmol06G0214800 [Rhododendron molle]